MSMNEEPGYQMFLTDRFWFPVSGWINKKGGCIYNAITIAGAENETHSTDNIQ